MPRVSKTPLVVPYHAVETNEWARKGDPAILLAPSQEGGKMEEEGRRRGGRVVGGGGSQSFRITKLTLIKWLCPGIFMPTFNVFPSQGCLWAPGF